MWKIKASSHFGIAVLKVTVGHMCPFLAIGLSKNMDVRIMQLNIVEVFPEVGCFNQPMYFHKERATRHLPSVTTQEAPLHVALGFMLSSFCYKHN